MAQSTASGYHKLSTVLQLDSILFFPRQRTEGYQREEIDVLGNSLNRAFRPCLELRTLPLENSFSSTSNIRPRNPLWQRHSSHPLP
jgi:hypothetical protein